MIYSGDGTTEYGIKHATHDYEREEIEWSGYIYIYMEVDEPCMVHWHNMCWLERKHHSVAFNYFVMWEQPLLSELVHVFAVMFKLG